MYTFSEFFFRCIFVGLEVFMLIIRLHHGWITEYSALYVQGLGTKRIVELINFSGNLKNEKLGRRRRFVWSWFKERRRS